MPPFRLKIATQNIFKVLGILKLILWCSIEHFRKQEDKLVDQLSNVMHDLGISRFNFAKEIPAEFESLETMLDTLGKKKRHSLGTILVS